MVKNSNNSGYEFKKLNYLSEIFWTKRTDGQQGQLIVYNFIKTYPKVIISDKNGIEGIWSGSYKNLGSTLLSGETFAFTKMKDKENEYWCTYTPSNGFEKKLGAHYEGGQIRIYGNEDKTFTILTYDRTNGKMLAPSQEGKSVYFVKLSN